MHNSKNLRELFKEDRLIYALGAHNGLSAKLVEKNGFDAVWASGLEISTSYAVPDANILTMTQYLEKATEMNSAVDIPIICDCDTGYGNSNNVIHLVQKYETAGIASICVEDKLFPKVNSFIPGRQELAPIAEFVGKILAAKNTQRSENFMFIARVEALIAGWGEEEALLRANKYADAGADAILIHSKSSDPEVIISFAKKWANRAPLVIVPTKYPTIMQKYSERELLDLGIKVIIFANHGLRASIKAMDNVMAQIKQDLGTTAIEDQIAPMQDVFALQGMDQMKKDEEKYLKSDQENIDTIFLAAGKPLNQDDLAPLLRDRPTAILDINGQPLIKRNLTVLAQAGISNTTVITGYHDEQFNSISDVTLIKNADYEQDLISSFLLAKDKIVGKTILAFADILFDKELIQKLIRCQDDLVLVVDATFKKMNVRNKKLDLVLTDTEPAPSYRYVDSQTLKQIVQFGENIPEDSAHYEFIGLSLWNEKSKTAFEETYNQILKQKGEGDSASITFNQVIQELINNNFPVSALEVNSGWMEVHTFENYKAACLLFPKKS